MATPATSVQDTAQTLPQDITGATSSCAMLEYCADDPPPADGQSCQLTAMRFPCQICLPDPPGPPSGMDQFALW